MTKEEARKPDELWQAGFQGMGFIQEHFKTVLIGSVVALVAIVGWFFYDFERKQNEADAQHLFGQAAGLYQQLQIAENDSTGGDASEGRSDFTVKLSELRAEFPSSQAMGYAELLEASLLLKEEKIEEARASLQSFEKSLSRGSKSLARYPLAVVEEEAGNWEAALSYYNQILAEKDSAYKKWALLGKARSLRELARGSEAVVVYDQFLQDFPDAPEAGQVRGLRNLAQAQTN